MRFRGSFTALITPFKDGRVDEKAFQDLVDWQIREGTNGLVPVGTTGESPTLDHAEHKRVVELCVEAAGGRVPVMAGCGSNSTAEAIDFSRHAEEAGADGLLHVCPYYNRPSQDGLYAHFKAIDEAVGIPIFIYNIPGRSAVDMSVETMGRLAKLKNIAGLKDAAGSAGRVTEQRLACGENFVQLCGDDGLALGFNAHGAVGCISVTSNVAPRLCAEFQAASLGGDLDRARALHDRLMPLHKALFVESSPAPVKFAASLLGKSTDEVRLPLVPASDAARRVVREAMVGVGLIN
jgi:4-hydroxy-tetrahydrodipicolinate synthase